MSLDKIINKIKEQAEIEAAIILDEAKAKKRELVKEVDVRLEKKEQAVQREEASIENEVKNAIVLPAKLSVRGEELTIKNEMVNKAFKESISFNDADYKKVLSHLFSDIPEVKEGVLYPAEGKEDLTKEFIKEKKIKVELGKSVPKIMGGFLLKAGKIEYDCSFVTFLKKIKEKLEPEIAPFFTTN